MDARLRVGGPATTNNEWITEFVDFGEQNSEPLDVVSTHHYPTDALGSISEATETQLAHSTDCTRIADASCDRPLAFIVVVEFSRTVVDLGHANPGVIDVPLQFAERLRSLHQRTIDVRDGPGRSRQRPPRQGGFAV